MESPITTLNTELNKRRELLGQFINLRIEGEEEGEPENKVVSRVIEGLEEEIKHYKKVIGQITNQPTT